MNHEYSPAETEVTSTNAFLPILLLALGMNVVFLFQLTTTSKQRTIFQDTLNRQDQLVKQSRQVQANLEKLVLGLMEVARGGDEDAKAIVTKYNIQQQAPPMALPAP